MVNFDLTPVLVALITAVAGYLSGYRRGRKIFRTGDYTSLPRKKPGDIEIWPPPRKDPPNRGPMSGPKAG